MTGKSKHALNSLELEVQRLLSHIDRNQARRFLSDPEPPTGFNELGERKFGWPDFEDSRTDAIGVIHRESRKEPYDPARFDQDLQAMLQKERQ